MKLPVNDMSDLSGAEYDTLVKLIKYGSQDDGDLPSKSGMDELINKGLADKNYDLCKPNYATNKGVDLYNGLG